MHSICDSNTINQTMIKYSISCKFPNLIIDLNSFFKKIELRRNQNAFFVFVFIAIIYGCISATTDKSNKKPEQNSILLRADRLYDGYNFRTNSSVLIVDGKISGIDSTTIIDENTQIIDLGDATIFPGFIELHAHSSLKKVPHETLLRHGITTIRDLNGEVHQPYGGKGSLRVLTSGPSITVPGGYPIVVLGSSCPSVAVTNEAEARAAVANNIKEGAVIIKITLEPGFEKGAPWSGGRNHSPIAEKRDEHAKPWPMLSENIVAAIVDEAHKMNRKVIAHVGESRGAEISLNAGVDEWAHVPCDPIPVRLLERAVKQNVKIITTMDALARCSGTFENARILDSLGAEFLYGAEVAHQDIPRGIDAQELIYIMQITGKPMAELLQLATSKAGEYLNIPLLGTIQKDAPADIIAIKGSVMNRNIKALEYPDFVMSGGIVIMNNFSQ